MNKVICQLLIALTLIGCATLHEPSKSNIGIGFRGALLGTRPLLVMKPLEKWRLITASASREISDAYSIPNEPLKLGSLEIKEVTYEYIDDKLFSIYINLATETQLRCPQVSEIISALESQYNVSMTAYSSDYIKSNFNYQWRGSHAKISYLCTAFMAINRIKIESIPLSKEVEDRLKIIKSSMKSEELEKIKRSLQ